VILAKTTLALALLVVLEPSRGVHSTTPPTVFKTCAPSVAPVPLASARTPLFNAHNQLTHVNKQSATQPPDLVSTLKFAHCMEATARTSASLVTTPLVPLDNASTSQNLVLVLLHNCKVAKLQYATQRLETATLSPTPTSLLPTARLQQILAWSLTSLEPPAEHAVTTSRNVLKFPINATRPRAPPEIATTYTSNAHLTIPLQILATFPLVATQ